MTDRKKPDPEAAGNGDSDTFLLRWSKRKARAERTSSAADEADPEPNVETGDPSDDAGRSQKHEEAEHAAPDADVRSESVEVEVEKGDEDMPSLDTIDQGGSVADFFSSRVTPALRQAALKRLFAQSTLPVGDALDDYAEDYTKFTKLGDIVTNEMRHRMEVARKRLLERNSEAEQADQADHVEHAEPRAEDDPAAAASAELESNAADEAQARRSDGEQAADDDAEHRADDTRITKESSRHEPDPG